jgi:hypothetical protein
MSRVIRTASLLLFVLSAGFASRAARGEPPSTKTVAVYVLSIWTDDADDQADALTQALRWRVGQTPGWSLVQTNQSFETLAIALKCPPKPDTACLQRIGDQLKGDRYVWGTMDKRKAASGEVNAELHLWTRGKPDASAHASYSEGLKDPNDEALRSIASSLFGKLTGAPAAAVPSASAETGTQPPSMVGGGLQALPTPAPIAASPPSAPGPSDRFPTRMVLAYSAVAIGAGLVVAAGVEAANWVSDSNHSSDDRKLVPRNVTDVCAEPLNAAAQDACSRSRDAAAEAALGWVFAGVGAALIGTGVWLLVTDHPSTQAPPTEVSRARRALPLEFVPSFGPRESAFDVRFTF